MSSTGTDTRLLWTWSRAAAGPTEAGAVCRCHTHGLQYQKGLAEAKEGVLPLPSTHTTHLSAVCHFTSGLSFAPWALLFSPVAIFSVSHDSLSFTNSHKCHMARTGRSDPMVSPLKIKSTRVSLYMMTLGSGRHPHCPYYVLMLRGYPDPTYTEHLHFGP